MEGIVGTPAYMAPEIIEHGMGAASTQSDLYALGATIYHLVTGQPPFVHDDPLHVMQAHVHEHPKPIDPSRHVPKRMQRMIMGLLDKDPSERGDSALLSHHCDDIIASLDATRLSLPGRIMATITHVFSSLRG
jgi:serine/threonine protein kinase